MIEHLEIGDEVIFNNRPRKIVGFKSYSSFNPLYLIEFHGGFILTQGVFDTWQSTKNWEDDKIISFDKLIVGNRYRWINHAEVVLNPNSLKAVVNEIRKELKVEIDHNFQYKRH